MRFSRHRAITCPSPSESRTAWAARRPLDSLPTWTRCCGGKTCTVYVLATAGLVFCNPNVSFRLGGSVCQQQTNPRDPGTHPSPITTVVDARPPLLSLGTFVCPRASPVPLLKTKRGCSASASPPPQEHFFAVLRDSRQDERFFEAVTNFIRASVGRLADCRRRRLVLQRRADAAGRVRRSRAGPFLSFAPSSEVAFVLCCVCCWCVDFFHSRGSLECHSVLLTVPCALLVYCCCCCGRPLAGCFSARVGQSRHLSPLGPLPAAKRYPLLFFFSCCVLLLSPRPVRRTSPPLLLTTPTSHFTPLPPSVPPAKGTVNGTVRGTITPTSHFVHFVSVRSTNKRDCQRDCTRDNTRNFSFCPLCLRPFHHPLVMSVRSWRRCEKWQPPVAFAPPPRRRKKSGKGSRPAGRSSSSSCFNGATTTPVNRGGGSTEGGSRNPATAASAAAPAAAGAYPSGEASAPAAGGGATGSGPRTPHRTTISIFRNPRAAPPRGLPCSAPAEGRTAPAPSSEAAAVAAAASPAPAPAATVRGVGR